MMVAIFSLWFITTLFAWCGFRRVAITLFAIALIISSIWFHHHVTTALHIDL